MLKFPAMSKRAWVQSVARDKRKQAQVLRILTHAGSLAPLAWLLLQFQLGWLGADPIREMTLQTGKTTLVLLILTLAVTPLNVLLGWKQTIPLRRTLGLYTFLYVSIHFLIFIGLDYGFNLGFILIGIVDQPYVLVGFLAFLMMLPLALTSNRRSMRRLGKTWKRLHRLIYVIGGLAILHYLWLVKNVYTEPLTYGAIVGLLLAARLRPVRQRLSGWQRRMRNRWSSLRLRSGQDYGAPGPG